MAVSFMRGRNSTHLQNSEFSPARIETQSQTGVQKIIVDFDIVAREGQFTDTTIANYASRQNQSIYKTLVSFGDSMLPNFWRGEFTTKYEGVSPKTLSFDIFYNADEDLPPAEIIERIKRLQSLCYPRFWLGGNPPLCMLHVLKLYSLEVFVQTVTVNWHNRWDVVNGLPLGADISMTVLMHQYPIREEILQGASFNSTKFIGRGWAGTSNAAQMTQAEVQTEGQGQTSAPSTPNSRAGAPTQPPT